MSASLDVKSHGWKPGFKVILIAAAFEGLDTIVFTKYGVCLDDPERRLLFSMSVCSGDSRPHTCSDNKVRELIAGKSATYEGWNFNSGNYLFTTDTK